jgi:mannose-6-phosphate isomerase-like protein (cupin superfamily)
MTPENVRPWGRYDILDQGDGFQVKRISVKPGQRLSYQSHTKREEHWVVVAGQARVTLDGREIERGVGETVEIPVGARHRIENPGEMTLVFIEVQLGRYLGEDDIKRHEDDYGRN